MFEVRGEAKRKKGLMYRYKAFFLAPRCPKGGNFFLVAVLLVQQEKERGSKRTKASDRVYLVEHLVSLSSFCS